MIAIAGGAPIGERLGQPRGEAEAAIHRAEQERAAVGGKLAAGEIRDHLTAAEGFKTQRQGGTDWRGRGGSSEGHKVQC